MHETWLSVSKQLDLRPTTAGDAMTRSKAEEFCEAYDQVPHSYFEDDIQACLNVATSPIPLIGI